MATTTEQPAQIAPTNPDLPHTVSGVLASALGAVFGGLGAGLIVGIVAWWLGFSAASYAVAALAVWGIVAGALLFWAFSRDPIRNAWEWETLRLELDRLDDENMELADALSAAQVRSAEWEARARQLRMQLVARQNYVPENVPDDPTRADAQTLVDLYFGNGENPTLREMQSRHGWNQQRFTEARRLLIRAGVVDGSTTRTAWLAESREAAQIALQ